jgi:hypothetical protein
MVASIIQKASACFRHTMKQTQMNMLFYTAFFAEIFGPKWNPSTFLYLLTGRSFGEKGKINLDSPHDTVAYSSKSQLFLI